MMQLIITIIALALAAALAVVAFFYGGDIFSNSTVRGEAAKTVNEITQIDSALQYYRASNAGEPADVSDLVSGNYINADVFSQASGDGLWTATSPASSLLVRPVTSVEACHMINEDLGVDTLYTGSAPPACGDAAWTGASRYCCDAP